MAAVHKTKYSFGIILCRPVRDTLEVMLIQKRFTYAYFDFIHCRGNYSNKNKLYDQPLIELFNQMTVDELLIIYSLDYRQMWYRIWLSYENSFHSLKNKFEQLFLFDGGVTLKALIRKSIPVGKLIWEIPKGRKTSGKEPDLFCAIREVHEECYINKDQYTLLPNVSKTVIYIHDQVKYVCKYYIAQMHERTEAPITMDIKKEIQSSRWCTVEELRLIDNNNHLERLIRPTLRLVKKYNKGKFEVVQESKIAKYGIKYFIDTSEPKQSGIQPYLA